MAILASASDAVMLGNVPHPGSGVKAGSPPELIADVIADVVVVVDRNVQKNTESNCNVNSYSSNNKVDNTSITDNYIIVNGFQFIVVVCI